MKNLSNKEEKSMGYGSFPHDPRNPRSPVVSNPDKNPPAGWPFPLGSPPKTK